MEESRHGYMHSYLYSYVLLLLHIWLQYPLTKRLVSPTASVNTNQDRIFYCPCQELNKNVHDSNA